MVIACKFLLELMYTEIFYVLYILLNYQSETLSTFIVPYIKMCALKYLWKRSCPMLHHWGSKSTLIFLSLSRCTGNITMRWHLGLSCIIHTGCTVQCCVSASMNFVLSISTLVRCVLDNEMGSCQLVGSFISAIVCLCDGVLCWFVLACAKELYWFFFFNF